MLASLPELNASLTDPNSTVPQQPAYCQNEQRSIKPQYFVAIGICTHLGCSPTYRPDVAPDDLGPKWLGGFFCACHGSRFDLAGRVFKGSPALPIWSSPSINLFPIPSSWWVKTEEPPDEH